MHSTNHESFIALQLMDKLRLLTSAKDVGDTGDTGGVTADCKRHPSVDIR